MTTTWFWVHSFKHEPLVTSASVQLWAPLISKLNPELTTCEMLL